MASAQFAAPVFDLAEAENRTLKIYQSNGLNVITREAAVQSMGYSSVSGASRSGLSALTAYGMVEAQGSGQVRVSTAFQAMKFASSDEDRRQYLQLFFSSVPAFAALLKRFPQTLPSDQAIVSYAVLQLNMSESAARSLTKLFRESARYAGVGSDSGVMQVSITQAGGGKTAPDPNLTTGITFSNATVVPTGASSTAFAGTVEVATGAYDDALPIRLRGGRKVWLRLPRPFFEADKEPLIAQIKLIVADEEESK